MTTREVSARNFHSDAVQTAGHLLPKREKVYADPMTTGPHDYSDDPRNAAILISVNGELKPRAEAVVSVFDSGFVLGDGVWEGLRLMDGGVAFLDQHLDRLTEGAKAIDMDIGLTRQELSRRLFDCLKANGMRDGVHIRLMVTRGIKRTPYQDPRMTIGPATIVIIPEYKLADPGLQQRGLSLFTVYVRRTGPAEQDQKLNSHSKLNCILACIQATKAGADEALMLDPAGFVATCNSTHFFIVRKGELWTSPPDYCLGGITRANILQVAREAGIPAKEKRFSLTDVYGADEAFVTGTFAGTVPVREVDGRVIGDGGALPGPLTARLATLYKELAARSLTPIAP
jgi:branched-chain amino acid aminotransferase